MFVDLDGVLLDQISGETEEWRVVISGDEIGVAVEEAIKLGNKVSNLVVNSANTLRVISQQRVEGKQWQRQLFKTLVLLSSLFGQVAQRLYYVHVEPATPNEGRQPPRDVPVRLYKILGEVWIFRPGPGEEPSVRRL